MTHSWCSFSTASSNRTVLPQPWREGRESDGYGGSRDDDVLGGVEDGIADSGLDAIEIVVGNDLPVHGIEDIMDANQVCIWFVGKMIGIVVD